MTSSEDENQDLKAENILQANYSPFKNSEVLMLK
jgi:hypothetical protein